MCAYLCSEQACMCVHLWVTKPRLGDKVEVYKVFLMLLMVSRADIGLCYCGYRWTIVMMPVGWQERDWSQLRDAVAIEEPDVRATLETCGLLKFFECSLIWAQEYLL
jgi:hypothetical protein